MRSRYAAFALLMAGSPAFSQSNCAGNPDSLSALGDLSRELKARLQEPAIDRLKQKGFVCVEPKTQSDSTRRCVGTLPGYPEKIAIYIPAGYDVTQKDPTVVTHFHGFTFGSPFSGTLAQYRLGEELHASGANKLLVIPESKDKCSTYKASLGTGSQFLDFQKNLRGLFQEVGLFAKEPDLGAVAHEITGHSGAYFPIGNILRSSCGLPQPVPAAGGCVDVKQVTLFDATYCNETQMRQLVTDSDFSGSSACQGLRQFAENRAPRLRSYFLEPSPTAVGSRLIFPKESTGGKDAGTDCSGVVPLPPEVGHLWVMRQRFGIVLRSDFVKDCPR